MNELIQQLAAAVTAMGPPHDVELAGRWSTSKRKTYKGASQSGSGDGPFIEVVDVRWRAIVKCAVPLVGIAFLDTPAQTFWVRSMAPPVDPDVEISLHAYAGYRPGEASFSASLFRAVVPAVPVACGNESLIDSCTLGKPTAATGSAHTIAKVDDTTFVMLVLPKTLVKTGRKRLWQFRPEFASSLEGSLRAFTSGRTGTLDRN